MKITMMRIIAAAIFTLFSVNSLKARELTIATWNIEHLAERNNSGCEPRQDADYAKFKSIVDNDLKADIIAFQEIENAKAAARVFDPATYSIEISNRPPRPEDEKPTCRSQSGFRLNDQLTGFAIRKGINYKRLDDYIDLAVGGRRGVVIEVTDVDAAEIVTLMSVHLKSSCPRKDYRYNHDGNCQKLKQQVPILEFWIDEHAEQNGKFILLGDFNRFIDRQSDVMWQELDDRDPIGLDLTRLDSGRRWPCKFGRLDHIVADAGTASQFDPKSVTVLDIVKGGSRNDAGSDHCPVVAKLDLTKPVEVPILK